MAPGRIEQSMGLSVEQQKHDNIKMNRPDYANEAVIRRNTMSPRSYWLPDTSLCLNGTWSFHYAQSPLESPEIVGCNVSTWNKIQVPAHWQLQGYGKPQYTNIVYPFPVDPPHVPDINPTGTYFRTFSIPTQWDNDNTQLRLRFDGVDSAYHVWLNDKFVGYAQGSRNPAEFDITAIANRNGENRLIVRVYQWSDGSYIEDQDQWWLSGIFRDVHLIAFPISCRIEDFFIRGNLDSEYRRGHLHVSVDVHCPSGGALSVVLREKERNGGHVLCEKIQDIDPGIRRFVEVHLDVENPSKWTAETPYLYDVDIQLMSGAVPSCVTHSTGFRNVELKDGLIKVNGQAVRFRGVNRHDHHPRLGRAVPLEFIRRDLLLMKRHNINALRCAHYPSHPGLYDIANEIGLWVMDEADLECHGLAEVVASNVGAEAAAECDGSEAVYQRLFHTIAPAASKYLSDNPLWREAYVDRITQVVSRDKNHPCIIIWSLGNESFCGENLVAMYNTCKSLDSSRLVHYEGDNGDMRTTDMYSYMYPALDVLVNRALTKGIKSDDDGTVTAPKPIILCEYAHAMGTGPGLLEDYEAVFHNYPRIQGGFVWEWANHGLETLRNDGKTFFYAYGGDFGEIVHDGTFVMDGLCNSSHDPMPGLVELKKAYSPVSFEVRDQSLIVTNHYDFIDLGRFSINIKLEELGISGIKVLTRSSASLPCVLPRTSTEIELSSYMTFKQSSKSELLLTVSVNLAESTVWGGDIGHEIAFFQHQISPQPPLQIVSQPSVPFTASTIQEEKHCLTIVTTQATFKFSKIRGLLQSWSSNSANAAEPGPVLCEAKPQTGALIPGFWRAPTDNDIGKVLPHWKKYGIDRLSSQFRDMSLDQNSHSGVITVTTHTFLGPASLGWGWMATTTYSIPPDGSSMTVVISLDDPIGDVPDYIPRIGLDLALPVDLNHVRWCGRGPDESYPDKKQGQRIGIWSVDSVAELQTPYEVPQENGNRTDTRWVEFRNQKGNNALRATRMMSAEADELVSNQADLLATSLSSNQERLFNFTATRHSAETLTKATHPQELVEEDFILLRLDAAVSGLGTAACGPGPNEHDLVRPGKTSFGFILELV